MRAMTDQQAHLPEWGPGKTAQGRARLPSSRPREKQQLSCNLCRRRKLRCDRQRPCGSCVQRELGLSCAYAHNNNSDRVSGNDAVNQRHATTQDRIHHLEKLVFDLMQQSDVNETDAATSRCPFTHASESSPLEVVNIDESLDADTPSTDYGSMQPKDGGANYVGSAHWAAVLDEIAELKDHLDNEEASHSAYQQTDSPRAGMTSPHLLHGFSKPATREDILGSIPSRPIVNRLVSRYFNSFEMSPAVLHSVQFLKEYEEFWEDTSKPSVIWLGLLFTIMCLATQFEKFRLDPGVQAPTALSVEEDLQKMADTFRLRIPQCLVLGNYTRGSPYVLETMMLYIAVEVFASNDAEIDIWILMGTTVQLAMHMGYHRDPRHFKDLSPFDVEMRRRVWATIVEMDLGISAQMGLPRMIKQWQTDTQEPSNLRDSDFDKSTVEMPLSRPSTDLTPILYRLVKARLMSNVGYIWDFAADVRSYPYTEVEKMDSRLDEARKQIPDCLTWHSIARCITDSPQIIVQKVVLETLFYRAKIVLHRKYMFFRPAKSTDSKRIVLESALKLLDYQHMLQEETQPFCQLYQERWRISSLVNHDFLLATSILCYYLQSSPKETESAPMNEAILASLRRSYDIWLQSSNSSAEARKVVKALTVVLGGCNNSSTDSRAEGSILLGVPSAYASPGTNGYSPDIPMGFGPQYPLLDGTLMPNWEAMADELISMPLAAPNFEWQTMEETVDTMSHLTWPWNLA